MYRFRRLIYWICAFGFICFNGLHLVAADIETKEKQLEQLQNQIAELTKQKAKAQLQFEGIAKQIADLNQQKDLNYLQRRRLEKYLKESQQQASQLETIQREKVSLEKLLDTRRHELISSYDDELRSAMSLLNMQNIKSADKQKTLHYLVRIKYKREAIRAQLNLPLQQENVIHTLLPEDMENRQQVRQHIDWLQDQNDLLRADAYELEHIISNLKAEVEIRDKMEDFENDIQLFDPSDEAVVFESPTINAVSEKNRGTEGTWDSYGPPEGLNNAYLQSESTSKSSLVQLLPQLAMQNHADLNNIDIEQVIVELDQRRTKLLQQADSMLVRSREFEKHLLQLQNQTPQDD